MQGEHGDKKGDVLTPCDDIDLHPTKKRRVVRTRSTDEIADAFAADDPMTL